MIKKISSLYTNWRNDVLFVLAVAALLCILSGLEYGTITLTFLLVKLLGFALIAIAVSLFRHWDGKGLLRDINDYCNEED